jgi:hypothetical protein
MASFETTIGAANERRQDAPPNDGVQLTAGDVLWDDGVVRTLERSAE